MAGHAMAALLVGMAVMAVFLSVTLPVWRTQSQREKETELIFRGMQYAHAIALFQRKYANASPPSIDVLVNEHFLRKKYKDPMTPDGEFQLVYANQQGSAQPSAGGATSGTIPTQGQPQTRPTTQVTGGATVTAQGGIAGVASKSTATSIRIYNGHDKYNEWVLRRDPGQHDGRSTRRTDRQQRRRAGSTCPGGRAALPNGPRRTRRPACSSGWSRWARQCQPGCGQNPNGPPRGGAGGNPFGGGGFGPGSVSAAAASRRGSASTLPQ